MSNVYSSAESMIGKTPLLRMRKTEKKLGLPCRLYCKCEGKNPSGSAKDRAAKYMLDAAKKEGRLKAGGTVIEPTSGNTGIALCALGAAAGYRTVIVMPSSMSRERIAMMEAYGATVILTDAKEGMAGAIRRAEELEKEIPDSVIMGQFENPANALAHYETTGPEIWEDTRGDADVLIAGVGTGGTFTGTARYLKEQKPSLVAVAVEPLASPLLSGGAPAPHGIQGIGANFIPALLDRSLIDLVEDVSEEDAILAARELAKTEGILCGYSGGAALAAAYRLAKRAEFQGKSLVVILPDGGDRYLSSGLFTEERK